MAADILLVSARPEAWEPCLAPVTGRGWGVRRAATLEEAVQAVRRSAPRVAVLDIEGDAAALRKAVVAILSVNASVHTALVSSLPEEAFHDAMEGLGVLTSLPPQPRVQDIERLLAALDGLA